MSIIHDRHVVYQTSQFKRLSYLDITINLAKQNTILIFTICRTKKKALIFSLKHTQNKLQMVENSFLEKFNTQTFS